jgi:hypothetical protein
VRSRLLFGCLLCRLGVKVHCSGVWDREAGVVAVVWIAIALDDVDAMILIYANVCL